LNVPVLVAVPAGVVTETWPLVALAGTLARILVTVSDTMAAGVPLNATRVAPERFAPVMVTVVPATPDVGLMLTIVGVTVVVIRPIELSP